VLRGDFERLGHAGCEVWGILSIADVADEDVVSSFEVERRSLKLAGEDALDAADGLTGR